MTDPKTSDTPDEASATPDAAAPATPDAVPAPGDVAEMPESATLVQEGSVAAPRPDRELEEAPRLLRNAAWVLLGGALIPFTEATPFMDGGQGWLSFGVAKLVGLLGCGVLAAAVFDRLAAPAPFGLNALTKIRLVPRSEPGAKPKNVVVGVLQSAPTALHLLGLALLVAAFVLPFFDPDIKALLANYDPETATTAPPASAGKAAGEVLVLLLGGCTLAHIFAYKKGGAFSPLYPFAFVGPAIMAIMTLYGHFFMTGQKVNFVSLLGVATVGVASAMGVHTIIVAMIQAKKEGDLKREAALEARRAARKSRGGGKGGSRRSR